MSTDTPNRQLQGSAQSGSNGEAPAAGPNTDPSIDKLRANGSNQENGNKAPAAAEPVGARLEAREGATTAATGDPAPETVPFSSAPTTNEWAEFSTLTGDPSTVLTSSTPAAKRSRTFPLPQIDDRIS